MINKYITILFNTLNVFYITKRKIFGFFSYICNSKQLIIGVIMAKTSFQAEYDSVKGTKLVVQLEMYEFIEDGLNIIYCPALDMSAYGRNEEEARVGFMESFTSYLNYCTSKNTLVKDLQRHGWDIKSAKQKKIHAPSSQVMIDSNETLRDIIFNKEYKKINQPVNIPTFA